MEFIEISAKTVDEAITKACIEMGTSSDNLDIQVVSEGSSGFLGLGSKPAIVKATRKNTNAVTEPKATVKETPIKKEIPKKKESIKKDIVKKAAATKEVKPIVEPSSEVAPKAREERQREPIVIRTEEEIADIKTQTQEFLGKLFSAMTMPVEIAIEYDNKNGNLSVDFAGEEMGILIGKRGQTLDSLQYLTSLVVNRDREGYIRVKLDTENYRSRRKDTLENLARNIAYKVKKSRRQVALEPMNPYERRIIHSSLQGNKSVETFSEGNEPYRHVVITLKR